ncbi:MAG: hypothetical protein AB3N33_13355 [Puniceicoccaceae bacterium]
MESSTLKLTVWTEGLGEFWGIATEQKERRQRGELSPDEVVSIIGNIIEENTHDANGLFILESGGRRLNVTLSNGVVEVSDPRNANYQNVAIAESELTDYLTTFFAPTVAETGEQLRTPLVQTLEYVVAVAAVVTLALTIKFVIGFMQESSQFMPEPEAVEIGDSKQVQNLTVQYAGIYATRMRDGEMIIELRDDNTWNYYDIQSGSLGSFILSPVSSGEFRPVYEAGRLAILTDTRYLFYPSTTMEEGITFLQRPFKKIANSRDDLPYVSFPDEISGSVAYR